MSELRSTAAVPRKARAAPPSALETAFAGFALLLSTEAFLMLLAPDQGASGSSSPLAALAWAAIALASVSCLCTMKPGIKAFLSDWKLWALIFMPVLSTLWSVDPRTTLRRSLALAGTMAFGTYFGLRFPLRTQMRILTSVLGFAAIASVLVVFFAPDVGIMHERDIAGAWRGVFPHKNYLGQTMLLNFLALRALYGGKGKSLKAYAMLLLSLVLLVFSGSKSSLLIIVAISVVSYIARGGPKRIRRWVLISAAVCALPFLFGLEFDDLLGYIGRNATLSGRTALWSGVGLMIMRRPLLGYGYSAFWSESNPDCLTVWRIAGWQASHSHNGFLEVMLGIGAIGLLAFLCVFGVVMVKAWRYSRLRPNLLGAFPLLLLIVMLIASLDESVFLVHGNIYTLLLVSMIATMRGYVPLRERSTHLRTRKPVRVKVRPLIPDAARLREAD